jgi:hypothetical protein
MIPTGGPQFITHLGDVRDFAEAGIVGFSTQIAV